MESVALSEMCVPLYDYQCKQCQKVTEVRHGFTEVYEQPCPECGGEVARVFNPAGIVFKGSGFYITDSRKSRGGGDSSKPDTSKPDTSKPDTSKPAASATPAPAPTAEAKKSDAA